MLPKRNLLDFDIPSYNKKDILSDEKVALINITKAKFIYDSKTKLYDEMVNEDVTSLFEGIYSCSNEMDALERIA